MRVYRSIGASASSVIAIFAIVGAGLCAVLKPALPAFVDIAPSSGISFQLQSSRTSQKYLIKSMPGGVAPLNYNGDGLQDLCFVNGTHLQDPMPRGAEPDKSDPQYWNRLYRNNGNGTFTDVTASVGLQGRSHGMGVAVSDCDNDGWKDLFIAQSHVMDNVEYFQANVRYLEPLLLLHNVDGSFENVSAASGPGFRSVQAGRGAAIGDLNNDGNLDIVASCLDGTPMVLSNQGTFNHWLTMSTVGTVSNRDSIGAEIRIVGSSGRSQFGFVSPAGSYLSANDKRVHFGLGRDQTLQSAEIAWPSGILQTIKNVSPNQILTVREPRERSQ